MIVDPGVVPGLLLLAAELAVLAGLGYVVVRVALRQEDELSALAQGLVVGPALWGIVVNFVMYAVPGLAGAAVGWVLMLGLAGGLAWRSPGRLGVSARTLAGFVGAVVVLGYAALASRQLVGIANPYMDLGMAAAVRAGAFPVPVPASPEATGVYHYGASLLAGVLAPPGGPDLAFVWELLGVYAWLSFALVVATALRQRGSWLAALTLAPLLFSYGLHTFVWRAPDGFAGVLSAPVPTGLPSAGLRAALGETYWAASGPFEDRLTALPDLWTPAFPLGYSLMYVVAASAARSDRSTWLGSLTVAGLVGFLGLLVTTLAPVAGVLWAALEGLRLAQARRTGADILAPALRSGAGLALAVLLLLFGGGALSGVVAGGGGAAGLDLTASLDSGHWSVLGSIDVRSGGLGLLELGPVAVAGIAIALRWRDRLVLALAAGAGLLALAWLTLDYPPRPQDLGRIAGHARNLALLALLLALSVRLAGLPSRRWRYAAGALLLGLAVWPTAVAPARSLAGAVGQGVQLANAGRGWGEARERDASAALRRYPMPGVSDSLAAYIRDHVGLDAHVLDPTADLTVLLNTGRPSNFGFANVVQLAWRPGPEYLDARHYLEPAAFRRLDLAYVFAPDSWVAGLPERARQRLADPGLFDLLIRDGHAAFFRVRPAFLALESAPHPESFEALRGAVAPDTVVYLQPQKRAELQERLLRVASALPQARLVGEANAERLHLRTPAPWPVEPLGALVPELVALPLLHEAWTYPPAGWREVWRNPAGRVAVYAPALAGDRLAAAASPVHVRLTDVLASAAQLRFTATLDAPEQRQWTGQDWVLGPVDASPWGIPVLQHDGQVNIEQWFAGQAGAGAGTTTHTYEFDAHASSLAVRGADGAFATVQASARTSMPGAWMLALRLTRPGELGVPEPAVIVPVVRLEVSDEGIVSAVWVYEAQGGWRPI